MRISGTNTLGADTGLCASSGALAARGSTRGRIVPGAGPDGRKDGTTGRSSAGTRGSTSGSAHATLAVASASAMRPGSDLSGCDTDGPHPSLLRFSRVRRAKILDVEGSYACQRTSAEAEDYL